MYRKSLIIVIAITALTALVLGGCYRTPEQRAERMVQHMAKKLDLNDGQKVKLEKIKDEFLARRPDMAKQREETVKEANELMKGDTLDQARLTALSERTQSQIGDFIKFVVAKFSEIHDMLTPEQRAKLVAEIETYHKRGHHR